MDTLTQEPAAPQAPTQPMSYAQISDVWNRVKQNPALANQWQGMSDMAQWYRKASGGDTLLAQGEHPSRIKDVSVGLDRLLDRTGLPKTAGNAVSGLYGMLGLNPEAGQQMGESLPRGFLDMGLVAGGAALAATPAAPLGMGMMGLGAASSGAKTYADTGSPVAGLISGVAAATFPKFMAKGAEMMAEHAGMPLLTKTMLGPGEQLAVPRFSSGTQRVLEKAFDWMGEQGGVVANMEAANIATAAALHQMPDFSAEHWAGLGLQMLPTIPLAGLHALRGPASDAGRFQSRTQGLMAQKQTQAINQGLQMWNRNTYVDTAQTAQADQLARQKDMVTPPTGTPESPTPNMVMIDGKVYDFNELPKTKPGTATTATVLGKPIEAAPLDVATLKRGDQVNVRGELGSFEGQTPSGKVLVTLGGKLREVEAEKVQRPFKSTPTPAPAEAEEPLPEWVTTNMHVYTDPLEKSGVADKIEELAAQGQTANQIAQNLGLQPIEVRAVRHFRGIPAQDEPEFRVWHDNYNQMKALNSAREVTNLATANKAPANDVQMGATMEATNKIRVVTGEQPVTDETVKAKVAAAVEDGGNSKDVGTQVQQGVMNDASRSVEKLTQKLWAESGLYEHQPSTTSPIDQYIMDKQAAKRWAEGVANPTFDNARREKGPTQYNITDLGRDPTATERVTTAAPELADKMTWEVLNKLDEQRMAEEKAAQPTIAGGDLKASPKAIKGKIAEVQRTGRKALSDEAWTNLLNTFDDFHKKFIGDAINEMSTIWGRVMDADISKKWMSVTARWLQDAGHQRQMQVDPVGAAVELRRQMGNAANKAVENRSVVSRAAWRTAAGGSAEPLTLTGPDGEYLNPNLDKLSVQAHEALESTMNASMENLQNYGEIVNPEITPEEVKARLPKGNLQQDVQRFNSIKNLIRDGQLVPRQENGKWSMTYSPWAREELSGIFGDVSWKTVTNYVNKNYSKFHDILNQRGIQAGMWKDGDYLLNGPFKDNVQTLVTKQGANIPLGVATKHWFRQWMLSKGYDPTAAERMSEVTMRLAALYPEVDKIHLANLVHGEGTAGRLEGVFKDTGTGHIGLSDIESIRGKADFNVFWKAYAAGHEAVHGVMSALADGKLTGVRKDEAVNVMAMATNLAAGERQQLANEMFRTIVPEELWNDTKIQNFVKGATGVMADDPGEFVSTIGSLVSLGLSNPAQATNVREYVKFLPKHLADFVTGQYLDLANMQDSLKEHLMANNVPQKSVDIVASMAESFRKLARTRQELEQMQNHLTYLHNSLEGGLPNMLASIQTYVFPRDMENRTNKSQVSIADLNREVMQTYKKDFGLSPNWFESQLLPSQQFAQRYPIVRPIIDLVFGYRSLANQFEAKLFAPFMTVDKQGQLSLDPNHAGLTKMLNTPKLRDAMNAVCLEQNARMKEWKLDISKMTVPEVEQAVKDKPPMSPQEIAEICKQQGLGDADINTVINTFGTWDQQTGQPMNGVLYSMKMAREAMTSGMVEKTGIVAAHWIKGVAGRNATDSANFGRQLAREMWALRDAERRGNSAGVIDAQANIVGIRKVLASDKDFDGAMKDVRELHDELETAEKSRIAQPYYTPEVRTGRYMVRAWNSKTNKPYFGGFDTQEQAIQKKIALQNDRGIVPDSIRMYDKADQRKDQMALSNDIAASYNKVTQRSFEMMRERALAKDPSEQTVALFEKFAEMKEGLDAAVYKEIQSKGIGKHGMFRSITPGRETINFPEGIINYLCGVSSGLAKGYTKDLAMLHLSDASLMENPKIRNLMKDYVSQVVDPPTGEWGKVKTGVFLSTIGMNFSSIIVERLQPLFTLVPYLTQEGAGLVGSYKLMGKAMAMLPKIQVSPGKFSGLSPELNEALAKASANKVIDYGIYQELAHDADTVLANLRNIGSDNQSILSRASLMAKPIYWYADKARHLYASHASTSSKIAFLSCYLHAQEQHPEWSPSQRYDYAVTGCRTTMFGGGSAARPIGAFNNLGKLYGAAGAMYTLQHFTTSSIGMMYRMAIDGFTGLRREGMTPAEITNMKKAFTQMFVTQMAAAGAMGLPMLGSTVSVLEQIFPNLRAKEDLRNGLASLAGDDKKTGEIISDGILHGFGTRALGLGQVDLSGRFGLGSMLGVDSENGFQPEGLLGSSASVLGNYLRAIGQASRGRWDLAAGSAAPSGFKNLIKLGLNDGEVRGEDGHLIYRPDDFEKVMLGLGFRPKQMSDIRNAQSLSQRASEVEGHKLERFHQELAVELLNGNGPVVREALMQRHMQDPLYNPVAGLDAVTQLAQARVTPTQPTGEGSMASIYAREQLRSTFKPIPQPDPVAQYQMRKGLEVQAGIPGAGLPSPSGIQEAIMTRVLMQKHPELSQQHAQALVSRMLGGSVVSKPSPSYLGQFLGSTPQ